MQTKQIEFKWTVSKAANTFGYNICALLVDGKKQASCNGGGYDMKGTVFAQWLKDNYQQELVSLFEEDYKKFQDDVLCRGYDSGKGWVRYAYPVIRESYGVTLKYNIETKVRSVGLDGACGLETMFRLAEQVGITMKWNPLSERFKNSDFYTVTINKPDNIMKQA